VLIHGGAGGVGHLAVQIAKGLGAHVIATASAGKGAFVRSLGADEVIDYAAADFARVTGDIDVVVESIGGDNAVRSIDVLKPGGLLVTLVERTSAAEHLAAWADAGRLRVHVDESFPFEAAARAHHRLDAGGLKGKLVLVP
jgi:NADPH:quinone reductase-like Zn-dependent oxidoreductase